MGIGKWFRVGSKVAKAFLPGYAGVIIDLVDDSIEDKDDPTNIEALHVLAEAQAELIERVTELEKQLADKNK